MFDNVVRTLTGLKCPFIFFLPFLCKGVTSDNFKEEGKLNCTVYGCTYKVRKYINNFLDNSSENVGFL